MAKKEKKYKYVTWVVKSYKQYLRVFGQYLMQETLQIPS